MSNYKVYVTAKDSDERLKKYDLDNFIVQDVTENEIVIDTNKKYQKFLGFGGALTESSAYVLSKLDVNDRKKVIDSYYSDKDGIGYNFGRTHIHSCDFSLGNYTYVEEGDKTLETFSLDRDEEYVLPLIRDIKEIKNDVKILASPWSPPKYMKTNGDMNHGGKLKDEFKGLWAKYYVKYIEEMKNKGIDIWGITVQNEPAANQVWDSCEYTAEEERDFVKNYLGPIMYNNGLQDMKIIIWDHNRDIVYDRAKVVLEDKETNKYIWGTGIHWYESEEFSNTTKLHNEFPDKHIIFTEGCQEGGVKTGEWFTGERYGRNIIGDLNNYVEAWIDWNIALDETGGPNHAGNLCDSPIIINTKNKEVIYNSSYYYIAHFSKFIKENAVITSTKTIGEKIHAVSCINDDNSVCVVIMNENNHDKNVNLSICNEELKIKLKGNSIYTITRKL